MLAKMRFVDAMAVMMVMLKTLDLVLPSAALTHRGNVLFNAGGIDDGVPSRLSTKRAGPPLTNQRHPFIVSAGPTLGMSRWWRRGSHNAKDGWLLARGDDDDVDDADAREH